MDKVLVVKPDDNVATCLRDFEKGQEVDVPGLDAPLKLKLRDDIGFGHKFAIRAIAAGEPVRKYAETIGVASVAIEPGDWVHVHNVESVRARGDQAGGARQ